jgi:hypothetical protein
VHSDGNSFSIGSTTANLGALKFGRNKDADPEITSFNPSDKIYIASKVSNSGETHKIKGYVLFDDVKGQESGARATENELEIDGDRTFNFNFSAKNGIPAGRYKVQVILFDKDGKKEIDREEGVFTVTNNAR